MTFMNNHITSYTAGIIDGEGTITLSVSNTRSQYRVPVVSVSSTTPAILEFLKQHYGGSISKHKVYKDHHKPSWSWKVTFNDAIKLCKEIEPLLLEPQKRYRAEMLVNGYHAVTKRNGKYNPSERAAKLRFESEFFKQEDHW